MVRAVPGKPDSRDDHEEQRDTEDSSRSPELSCRVGQERQPVVRDVTTVRQPGRDAGVRVVIAVVSATVVREPAVASQTRALERTQ